MNGGSDRPTNEQLLQELGELRRRVEMLERALSPTPGSPAHATGANSTPAQPPTPSAVPKAKTERAGRPSALESRIGEQFFNRVGVFAVLAGAAWFLKLAIDRAWVGPGLRVVLGLVMAIMLVVWSERFRPRSPVFSYTLKALGAGVAYLALWASLSLYHLMPAWVVLGGMTAVTVGNAWFALRQESEMLAALALAGGLATPALLSTGGDQEVPLFCYLLLLDVGALGLSIARPWPRLIAGAFSGTTAYFLFWWIRYYVPADEVVTGIFVALFFGLFTAAPFLKKRPSGAANLSAGSRWLVVFPVPVGVCAFFEAYRLLSPSRASAGGAWIAAALGVISTLLAIFSARKANASDNFARRISPVHLALAVGFFTLAAFLGFDGYGVALGWLLELALLTGVALRIDGHGLAYTLRGSSLVLLMLSLSALLLLEEYDPQSARTSAVLNAHFATYVAGLAVFAGIAAAGRQGLRKSPGLFSPSRVRPDSWILLTGAAVIAFNLTALLAVSLQIHFYWLAHLPQTSGFAASGYQPAYVGLTYSAWFMLYGGLLMAAGFLRRSAFVRWQALLLLTMSIGKVFLVDTSQLNEGSRVASFLGLGVLLLAVSFVYQRDWLNLKSEAAETTAGRAQEAATSDSTRATHSSSRSER